MSTDLTTNISTDVSIWHPSNLSAIKEIYGKDLSDLEFKTLVGIGHATGLNPFLREIWAVKYPGKPAQIFVGRDGYRKTAQKHHDYDYHHVAAIYSEDFFEVHNNTIDHKYSFAKRGILLGAYCIAKRKSSPVEMFVTVKLSEYDKDQSTWKTMKETMIKKVAEAQALRGSFQEIFGGTLMEEEKDIIENTQGSGARRLKSVLSTKGATYDNENINHDESNHHKNENNVYSKETIESEHHEEMADARKSKEEVYNSGCDNTPINEQQVNEIINLFTEKAYSPERINKVFSFYKIDELNDLSDAQARLLILQLKKS